MIPVRLIKMRRKHNLSRRELGKKINMTSVTIGMYESGKITPNTETIKKLAESLHCSIDYLLGVSDSPYVYKLTDEKFLFDPNITVNELVTFSSNVSKMAPFSSFRNAQIILSKFELLSFAMRTLIDQIKRPEINNSLYDLTLDLVVKFYRQLCVIISLRMQLTLQEAVLTEEQREYLQKQLVNINQDLNN